VSTTKAEEVAPFYFESAPNILDDSAEEQEDGKRKRRKRGVLDRGDFPAPLKDRREVECVLSRS